MAMLKPLRSMTSTSCPRIRHSKTLPMRKAKKPQNAL